MGEYAIRVSDGERIKIGTCESMYYLRYEDRNKVLPLDGNVDPVRDAAELRFRLPFPDEDGIQPGEYSDHDRGFRLCRKEGIPSRDYWRDFSDPSTIQEPGIMQLRHEASGLLLNVPCYHGEKLPDVVAPMKVFWNGKGHSLELVRLRPVMVDGELRVFPVVQCRHCRGAWRYQWSDIWDYIADEKLRERLSVYLDAAVAA